MPWNTKRQTPLFIHVRDAVEQKALEAYLHEGKGSCILISKLKRILNLHQMSDGRIFNGTKAFQEITTLFETELDKSAEAMHFSSAIRLAAAARRAAVKNDLRRADRDAAMARPRKGSSITANTQHA